jgi:hypothetical protein
MAGKSRGKLAGRSHLARAAHFRTGAGPMGGTRREQTRRRRRLDRQEEQRAQREERAASER